MIASVRLAFSGQDLVLLREDLVGQVAKNRAKNVILDVTALELMDSFATRTLRDLAQSVRLRGAETVIVGIQPEVAFARIARK